jgi:hypothetical protein
MEINMRENFLKMKKMDMVFIIIKMEKNMKENLKKTKKMDMEYIII